eukprot:TRINITY_DN60535_c0_g1_i1.p2 TRINITY_DN60535_c0_g1~~TRINITY_DN60535_c0_g1_i1.p2  ORF type:complete len:370 (+),score=88.74 TRINITY_DN60535_c0_g1_i1:75-1184(+)
MPLIGALRGQSGSICRDPDPFESALPLQWDEVAERALLVHSCGSSDDTHPDTRRGRVWAFWAIAAALCFGATAYTSGYVATYQCCPPPAYGQWFASFIVWRSTGLTGVSVVAWWAATGRGLRGMPDAVSWAAACLAGACMVGGMLCMMNGMRLAPHSLGPFQAIVASQSLFVAAIMAAAYRELPSAVEAAGVLLTVAGAACIAVVKPDVNYGNFDYEFAVYAAGTTFCFAGAAVCRRVAGRRGADPASVAGAECLVMLAAGQVADLCTISLGTSLWGQTLDRAIPETWLRALAWGAGMVHACGVYCITRAHRTGPGSVVNGIAGFEPAVVLLLQLALQGIVPPWEHSAGTGVAMLGVVVSAFGPVFLPQ